MKQILCLIFLVLILNACQKDPTNQSLAIDVSEQWTIDGLGNLIFGYNDGQWQSRTFTSREQALFSSMDTANLSGTAKPDSVFENTLNYNSAYPNPFVLPGGHRLIFRFSTGYSGQVVLKVVYVDSLMDPLYKTVIRLQASVFPSPVPSSSNEIAINPSIPTGRFRLYYTLSAAGNPHFYKSWGDIQRVQ